MSRLAAVLPLLLAACGTPLLRPATPGDGPREDEAKIVVYRPGSRMAEKNYPVYDGQSLMGFAEAGGFFEYYCPPGKHLFWISGATDGAVNAELAPGKTYYLQARMEVSFLYLRPRLVPVAEGSEEKKTLREDLEGLACREYTPELAARFRADRLEVIAERWAGLSGQGAENETLRAADGN